MLGFALDGCPSFFFCLLNFDSECRTAYLADVNPAVLRTVAEFLRDYYTNLVRHIIHSTICHRAI